MTFATFAKKLYYALCETEKKVLQEKSISNFVQVLFENIVSVLMHSPQTKEPSNSISSDIGCSLPQTSQILVSSKGITSINLDNPEHRCSGLHEDNIQLNVLTFSEGYCFLVL